ncbi:unnamed protein product [Pleuronectes platessa]|uniref:Uncharacterized protein n=1 Tax=Pleuronectes platessa TaxID=8262 RepID=A0A9N7Y9C5_PLEPL|nr:unnamed protein product [Pleuronectes platessa]
MPHSPRCPTEAGIRRACPLPASLLGEPLTSPARLPGSGRGRLCGAECYNDPAILRVQWGGRAVIMSLQVLGDDSLPGDLSGVGSYSRSYRPLEVLNTRGPIKRDDPVRSIKTPPATPAALTPAIDKVS